MRLADEVNILRSRPSLSFTGALFMCTSFKSRRWLSHIQFFILLHIMCGYNKGGVGGALKVYWNNNPHLWLCGDSINNTGACGQWLSHAKTSSGKVSLTSFHLLASIFHHTRSLLFPPPHLHFCVRLSPGFPIEDFLSFVARWWAPLINEKG